MSPSALFVTTVPVTLEVFLVPFARHFRGLGWRIDGLANGAAGNAALEADFDRLHDAGWTRNPLSPSNLIGTAARVRQLVTNNNYDIVHVHTPIAAFVTRFALRGLAQSTRPIVIYTAHGFHFYSGQNRLSHAVYRTMERVAARWTDYLVTINAEDHAAALSLGTIDRSRVRLINGIGVDIARFADAAQDPGAAVRVREELGVSEDAFLLLMIAEFGAVKRHAHLIDALARVTNPDVVVVFAGDGPLESEVRASVSAHGLRESVRFAGYRRDIPQLLSASDALVLVSEREGLPRSVLEAMASGIPVIGTRTRGITDAVGDTGWVVPKYDPAALAAAIDESASNPAEAHRRGLLARARAQQRFSLDSIIADYEELYREALAARLRRD